ncbi:uncharacterized protein SPPG_04674 [Spizellomyces punctatus DAOM BR117]|uniref:C2H2-type domain-containing protein n=1 Tax=Spizellomyces punctatus (strain DAOM BR117) TaxID=645134 RepID=A0A0L0HFT6_SPIPD|nr:uncharacterized protein SPPG_04674 [Spizellomyces punctatus DAOM BR117]KND00351.1 hypothetical protein SPPG_04674 [Spizellomyces punctatus DAOM BR117]|eukprot:XP_016608390.1 hypothetical protein SPPG_04674 [Spizellomyces punctatus DAOM BR117]
MTFAPSNTSSFADCVLFDDNPNPGTLFPDYSEQDSFYNNGRYLQDLPPDGLQAHSVLKDSNYSDLQFGFETQGQFAVPYCYPTPALTPSTNFENSPTAAPKDSGASDSSLLDQLLRFDETNLYASSTDPSIYPPSADESFALLDAPLFDPTSEFFPPVAEDSFFSPLPEILAEPSVFDPEQQPQAPIPQSTSSGTVTLSVDLLSALIQLAAQKKASADGSCTNSPEATELASPLGAESKAREARRRVTKKYTCPIDGCNRDFTRRFNLETHLKIHDPNRERPFSCDICGKAFLKASDLARHGSVHNETKQHSCPALGCGKRFSRSDALRRHMKTSGCTDPLEGK